MNYEVAFASNFSEGLWLSQTRAGGRVGLRDGRNEAGEHREGLQGERSTLLHEGEWK